MPFYRFVDWEGKAIIKRTFESIIEYILVENIYRSGIYE